MNTESINDTNDSNSNHRRRGNIAKLPKALRDKINSMMDDNIDYPEIIQALGDEGKHLHPSNFTHWKNGGYQDYLRDQAWRERLDANADRYLEAGLTDGTKLAAGGLYAASVQICKLMDELSDARPGETDADKCSRVTNALSRLSRSILMLQQYRDQLAKEKAAELKQLDPKRELAEDETLAIVDQVNKLFGLRQYRKPRTTSVPTPCESVRTGDTPCAPQSEIPNNQTN